MTNKKTIPRLRKKNLPTSHKRKKQQRINRKMDKRSVCTDSSHKGKPDWPRNRKRQSLTGNQKLHRCHFLAHQVGKMKTHNIQSCQGQGKRIPSHSQRYKSVKPFCRATWHPLFGLNTDMPFRPSSFTSC